ncbi:MAG: right-handed parallel beta-helix repeat-containing protein [Tyzzerella sp.]|nr:right-handed parallel beta-helix repeat-containing protein [Tyzzerella sp.]
MEMSNEITKNKKKFPIGLIICLALLIVCAGATAGALILKNVSSSKNIELSEQMEAADEETLRKILAADGTCTITLTEDVVVSEELDVNGTKTIVGNKSIIMDTFNIGTVEAVCAVQAGAHLTLDGATIDGSGVVNGIAVKSGGELTCLSGDVVFGYPYGLTIAGLANIEDITIDETLHTGIYVEYGGEAHMNGGVIKNNLYGVAVASQASMTIGGDSVITKSNAILINNYGKLDITGGKFTDAFDNAITNQGEMTIKGSADKMVEIGDVDRSAIVSKKNSKLTVEYLHMHDLGLHAIDVEKDSEANIQNCVAEKAGRSCFYVNNSKVVMKDVSISDCESYAIYGTKNSNVELEGITVKDVQNRGIVNDGAKMTAKDVVIENTKKNAFHTMGEGAVTKIENLKVVTPNSNAIAAVTGGNVNAKNVTIEEPKNEGLIVNADSKIEIENVTINKSGMTSVANNGGTLAARNITIISPKNIGIKTTDGGTSAVKGAVIKNTASHALAVEKGSTLTVSDCKMDKVGWDKVKSAVYISKSKFTMKNSELNDVASYGIYVVDGGNTTERETYLENVTITKVGTTNGHRGIANVDSRIALKDVKVSNVTGAGIYTKGATSVTNMNGVSVSDTKGPALGFIAGTVTVKNTEVEDIENDGVHVGKEAQVRLDNIAIENVKGQGVGNYGGVVNITADKEWNTANTEEIGAKITIIGESGIYSEGGTSTAKNTTVINAKKHAVCLKKSSDAIINQCTFDTTEKSAVYVLESKIDLKNSKVLNAGSYGVYVEKSAKADEKGATLENVTVSKAGYRGIANINSYVVVKNSEVVASKGAGVYTSGVNAITLMNEVVAKDTGASGFALTGGQVQARNITISNTKNEGIYVGKDVNVKNLDNVTIKDAGTDGIKNEGGTVHITVNKTYNPENVKENGVTIVNPGRIGIWNTGAGTLTGKSVVIQDTVTQGIYVTAGHVDLDETTVNNASGHGVSLYGESAKATFSNLTINDAKSNGIYVEDGTLESTGTITIDGKVTGNTAVTGEGLFVKGGKANIADITVVNTKAQGLHFAKSSAGNVADATIEKFDVSNTNLSSSNAVVYVDNAKATLKNGTINAKNTRQGATTYGINITESTKATDKMVVIENVTISEAGKYGIYNSGSWVEMTDITVDESTDDAIYVTGANAVVNMDTVDLTELSNRGLVIAGGTVTGKNVSITEFENEGIKLISGTSLSLDNATIVNESKNSSSNKAGILNEGGTLTITADNQAVNGATIQNVTGDGIKVNNNGVVNATGVTVKNSSGCGIYNEKGGTTETPNVYKNVVINNVGKFGVYVQAGQATLDNVDIKNVTGTDRDGIKSDAKIAIVNGAKIENVASGNGLAVSAIGNVEADTLVVNQVSGNALFVKGGNVNVTVKLTVSNVGAQAVVSKDDANVSIASFDEINSVNTSNAYEETVLVENAKLTLKNGTINTGDNYGIKVTESTKPTEKKVVLENVTINTPSKNGIYNNGSWVEMTGVTVVNSADDSINAEGADSVTDMSNITLTNPGKRGLYLAAGTSDINGISITGAEDYAMQIGPSVLIGKLYDVTINGADDGEGRGGKHGIYVEDEALVQDAKNISISNMAQKGLYMKKGNATQSVINTLVINNVYEQGIQLGYGANVKVSNFEVSNSNSKDGSNAAVYVHDQSKNVVFENGTISAVKNGITIAENSELVATNVQIIRANETNNNKTLVSVGAGTKFTLNENNGKSLIGKETESHTAYEGRGVEVSGEFVLNGGTITGNKITNSTTAAMFAGAGVLVKDGATFTMNGGSISYNIASGNHTTKSNVNTYGAGVAVEGNDAETQFIMTGGSISHNDLTEIKKSNTYGAGVALNGAKAKFEMSGGDISDNGNNDLNAGGAVSINSGSTFILSGSGLIQRNKANNGGAIHHNSGNLTMDGGTIDSNEANENGGAIYINGSLTFTMNKGTISKNNAKSKGGGIYLTGAGTVKLSDGTFSGNTCSTNNSPGNDMYANDVNSKGKLQYKVGYNLSGVAYNSNFTVSELTQ